MLGCAQLPCVNTSGAVRTQRSHCSLVHARTPATRAAAGLMTESAPARKAAASDGLLLDAAATTSVVQEYYGATLQSTNDLVTGACLCASAPSAAVRALLSRVPRPVVERFYGCGSPLPPGIEGLRVLDLGSGSGRDAYVAAALVGSRGSVVGLDFSRQQLDVARAHVGAWTAELGYSQPNLRFVEGRLEDLAGAGVAPASVDLVLSNCVVNLSPDKRAVLQGVWDALAEGGEFHFSDVYCDRRLPASARADPLLLGECLGGALYVQDFLRLAVSVGFADPRIVSSSPVPLRDDRVVAAVGAATFSSITYRLFKLPKGRLESICEDYGQFAIYKGTIPGCAAVYDLDDHHRLEAGKPFLVCGNTASMLSETWLSPHFAVHGSRDVHYGAFPCGPAPGGGGGGGGAGGACCV